MRTPSNLSPNQNLTDGLIGPPGSVHPSGGHQALHGPLTAAQQLAATGNPQAVLERLRALLKGRTPTEALEILGADCEVGIAAATDVRAWANRQDHWRYGTALEAGTLGEWTIVVELNGFRATDRELLSRLSEGGEAVVIYRTVNSLSLWFFGLGRAPGA